jgi:hypothetical protein
VEKELAVAEGVVVEDIGRLVGADVALDEEDLAVFDLGVALLQADPAVPDGFDLAALKGQAGLELFQDFIIMGYVLVNSDGPGG